MNAFIATAPVAPAGSSYRASFKIGHGCDGAAPHAH
jgi:uncharacterized protein YcnI